MRCRDFQQPLSDYIDGKLARREINELMQHIQKCSRCYAEFNTQKIASELLKRFPVRECPESVIRSVMRQINFEYSRKERLSERSARIFNSEYRWATGIVLAVAVIIITIVLYPEYQRMNVNEATYTAEEVIQAKKDVVLALGYFSYYTKKTEKIIEDQVFSKSFTKPIKAKMKTAFKPILNGGEK